MNRKTCRACEGPLCLTCGGCIQEGECGCKEENRHIDRLGQERDELLEICETIHEWLGTADAAQALPFELPWYQQLRDAIRKAKGEAPQ